MAKIIFVTDEGSKTTVEATDGDSLMQAAINNNIDGIVGECGGSMVCSTCHIYVEEAFLDRLPPRSEGENELLDFTASERRTNSRLSCQIIAGPQFDGMIVHMPEHQQ